MDFLSVLKEGYEKNEHLRLLVKYNSFIIGVKINEDLFFLQFTQEHCLISTTPSIEAYPMIVVTNEGIEALGSGILLSKLIKTKQIIYLGTIRDQLLIESILYLSMTGFHHKIKKVLVIR